MNNPLDSLAVAAEVVAAEESSLAAILSYALD